MTMRVYSDKLKTNKFTSINLLGVCEMEKLFDSEFRLMEVLWDCAPINSTELVRQCQERLNWNKSTTYTVLRKLCQKGAAQNRQATVTVLLSREEVIRERGEELARQSGGVTPFLTAFLSGRKLTIQEAEQLKELIDRSMGED